jgi:hypothetical protein
MPRRLNHAAMAARFSIENVPNNCPCTAATIARSSSTNERRIIFERRKKKVEQKG